MIEFSNEIHSIIIWVAAKVWSHLWPYILKWFYLWKWRVFPQSTRERSLSLNVFKVVFIINVWRDWSRTWQNIFQYIKKWHRFPLITPLSVDSCALEIVHKMSELSSTSVKTFFYQSFDKRCAVARENCLQCWNPLATTHIHCLLDSIVAF